MKTTLRDVVAEFERARGAPLSLEDKLRLSIAENERNQRMQHEDLYEAIDKRRTELTEDLARMRAERDAYVANTNAKIKMAQDALDALPVPKTRRRSPGRKLADSVVAEATARHMAQHAEALDGGK